MIVNRQSLHANSNKDAPAIIAIAGLDITWLAKTSGDESSKLSISGNV